MILHAFELRILLVKYPFYVWQSIHIIIDLFTSHGISKPSPSITSESCGPRTIVGGANTFSIAGGAVEKTKTYFMISSLSFS